MKLGPFRSALTMLLITSVQVTFAQESPALNAQRSGENLELRWRSPSAGATAGRATVFQLQSSEDLKAWNPLGDPIRAASADELHLRSFATDRAWAFYRLLARYESIAKALASGGAEVFGYGSAFATELAGIGQITPEQFAARYPIPTNYLPQVTFNVTQARFFDDFNADPQLVNAVRARHSSRCA